jgi:OOP family OmpA-OmpF porin
LTTNRPSNKESATNMKKLSKGILPALLLMALATPGFGENRQGTYNLSPFVGGYVLDHKQREENGAVFGLRGGYNFTRNVGAEAMFGYSLTETKTGSRETDLYRYGVDLLYHFRPGSNLVPFIVVGGGGTNFTTPNTPSAKSHYAGLVNYGVGLKYFVTDNVALRGDVRHVVLFHDSGNNNLEYSAGLTFQFGGNAKPAPAPVAQQVAPTQALPVDSDGDGVPDTLDKCPGTPTGVDVDNDGCPLDADGDGVPDYLDKCPGTPAGVTVDKDGCPLDADRDGVPDYLDKCPGTPVGVKVDATGCPPEVVVPAHVKAAAANRFCSKPAVLAINFDTNMSDIKPGYHDELKTVGDFLIYFPNAKGEISGHTDSTASNEYNQELSERRAESVEKYISTKFGITPGRITTKGYGETKPIASNKTKAGRAKNRRIEANFTCD